MFHQRASPSVNVQQAFPAAKTRAHLNFQGRTDLRKLVVIEELRLREPCEFHEYALVEVIGWKRKHGMTPRLRYLIHSAVLAVPALA
jgi:hypothetical protein